jgi:hypothetical protein
LDTTLVLVDYNRSVLESMTVPNLFLNTRDVLRIPRADIFDDGLDVEERIRQHIILGSGDWMSEQLQGAQRSQVGEGTAIPPSSLLLPPRLPPDGRFHTVLAAETLYTPQAARETAQLVMRHLLPGAGVAYVASKRYYFGVGGGVDDFRSALDPTNFRVETVQVVDTGVGNIREILKVTSLAAPGDARVDS